MKKEISRFKPLLCQLLHFRADSCSGLEKNTRGTSRKRGSTPNDNFMNSVTTAARTVLFAIALIFATPLCPRLLALDDHNPIGVTGAFEGVITTGCAYNQVHAYCLMSNHFHLVVETPRANLVEGMKWLLGTYTMRFNRRHKLSGHLFAGRYKSLLIDGATPGYLRTVCDYVHLNPVRARLVGRRERLQKYRWSSYPSYLRSREKRESWLRCDRLFGEHGLTKESRRSRLEFARRMKQRCVEPNDPNAEQIRRVMYLWTRYKLDYPLTVRALRPYI